MSSNQNRRQPKSKKQYASLSEAHSDQPKQLNQEAKGGK